MEGWFPKRRIGLALGGGAARGIAHIGVISVLEENGIEVSAVSGTSMGAIVGAVYLLEGNARRLIDRMNEIFTGEAFQEAHFDVLRQQREEDDPGWFESMTGLIRRGYQLSKSVIRKSIIEPGVWKAIIDSIVPDIRIEELPKPFSAVALDVVSGEEVLWTNGSLRDALWATSAIPGFFPPFEQNGRVMVDGAWTNTVPVEPAKALGAERVIAVDISREIEEMVEYKRGISLILRSAVISSKHLRERQLRVADVVLRPEVGCIHWADFEHPEAILEKGRVSALLALEEIKKLKRPIGFLELLRQGLEARRPLPEILRAARQSLASPQCDLATVDTQRRSE